MVNGVPSRFLSRIERWHRRAAAGAIVAAAALVLAGCSGSGGGAAKTGANGQPLTTINVGVTVSSLETVIYAIADQQGDFAKHGLSVNLTKIQSGQEDIAMQQMVQGKLDFALTAAADAVTADGSFIDQGSPSPLRIVAAGNYTTSVVLAKKVSYSGIDSLKGLHLAVSNPTASHALAFDYYLRQHGTSVSDLGIKFVSIGSSDMPAALASGQVDGFIHAEPTTSLAVEKDGAKVAFNVTGEAQQAAVQALSVPQAYLKAHRQTVADMVAALQEASKAYASMSKATVTGIYAKWLGADNGLMGKIYDAKSVDPRLVPLRPAATAFWAVNRAALLDEKSIKPDVTLDQLFDYSLST